MIAKFVEDLCIGADWELLKSNTKIHYRNFWTKKPGNFADYVQNFLSSDVIQIETINVALVYLTRLPKNCFNKNTIHLLFAAALSLAIKFCQDFDFEFKNCIELFGIESGLLCRIEMFMLFALQAKLRVQ